MSGKDLVGVGDLDEPVSHVELDERRRHVLDRIPFARRLLLLKVKICETGGRPAPASRIPHRGDAHAQSARHKPGSGSRGRTCRRGLRERPLDRTVRRCGDSRLRKDKLGLLDDAGNLTIGADNPAFPPWFGGDEKTKPWKFSDPYSGKGYESAVAYAVAKQLGFTKDQVKWTVTPFNNSFRPGKKSFDFYITQVSYNPSAPRRSTSRRPTTSSTSRSSVVRATRSLRCVRSTA